ncbi:phage portal protein [Rhodococcus sp. H36-A4]|uniref:phage portal protein n=1 Tax=Rhodococcus sp. H36-A4 TaxID=3004353 RepID=UPI0022AFE64D|nr:phage portal protein [Rhodococcus sp. H36-A4]MCZ4079575.1 phage portal protein [Rhodococcus sp. H36-A4]
MSLLTNSIRSILDRQDEYLQAENYYNGTVDEIFASASVKRELAKTGDHYRVNYAATPVNAVANRLEVTGVTTLSDSSKKIIGDTWQENSLELELTQLITKTLVYGSAYMTVWPDADGQVQLYYNSPLSTVVLYDPENPRRPIVAAKLWQVELDGKPRSRVNLYYPDRIDKYLSQSERLPFTVKDSDFEPFIDDETDENGSVPNEFGVIPVFHFTTGIDQYGRPEHISAYSCQDMINKMLVSQLAAVEHHGFPTRWMLQGDQTGTSSDWGDLDEEDQLTGAPGEVWSLAGVMKVGQFTAADPSTYIDPYKEYVRAMASVTDTPFHVFEAVATNVSGEALRASEAPLVKKVRTRQLALGNTLRRVFMFVLKLNGIDEDVQVQWKQIESIDTSEQWSINKKKLDAGLPIEQILLEHGYDSELVTKWKNDGLLNVVAQNALPNTTTVIEGELTNE